jgi:UDP-glucose 4-epimerase
VTELRGARTLITGGAGVIGSAIADRLVEAGVAQVLVIDDLSRGKASNLKRAQRRGRVDLVEGDIRDPVLVARMMDGIEVVFHQAALRLPLCAEQPRRALEVMVDGTFNVVDAASRAGVAKLVMASSASIYGLAETFPTEERHHPYGNRTLYGAAKVFAEGLLRSYHETSAFNYVALRYFNVYGPRMDIDSAHVEVFIRWMQQIDRGEPPMIHGDGSQSMDFVYVDDVARANLLAAEADASDEVFNVASGTETTLNELASLLLELMGSDLKPQHGPHRDVSPASRRVADVRRAADALGFRAEVDLREGLGRLISWWRAGADGRSAA